MDLIKKNGPSLCLRANTETDHLGVSLEGKPVIMER